MPKSGQFPRPALSISKCTTNPIVLCRQLDKESKRIPSAGSVSSPSFPPKDHEKVCERSPTDHNTDHETPTEIVHWHCHRKSDRPSG